MSYMMRQFYGAPEAYAGRPCARVTNTYKAKRRSKEKSERRRD